MSWQWNSWVLGRDTCSPTWHLRTGSKRNCTSVQTLEGRKEREFTCLTLSAPVSNCSEFAHGEVTNPAIPVYNILLLQQLTWNQTQYPVVWLSIQVQQQQENPELRVYLAMKRLPQVHPDFLGKQNSIGLRGTVSHRWDDGTQRIWGGV